MGRGGGGRASFRLSKSPPRRGRAAVAAERSRRGGGGAAWHHRCREASLFPRSVSKQSARAAVPQYRKGGERVGAAAARRVVDDSVERAAGLVRPIARRPRRDAGIVDVPGAVRRQNLGRVRARAVRVVVCHPKAEARVPCRRQPSSARRRPCSTIFVALNCCRRPLLERSKARANGQNSHSAAGTAARDATSPRPRRPRPRGSPRCRSRRTRGLFVASAGAARTAAPVVAAARSVASGRRRSPKS